MSQLHISGLTKGPISLSPHILNNRLEVSNALVLLADRLMHGPLIFHELLLVLFLKGLSLMIKLGSQIFVLLF